MKFSVTCEGGAYRTIFSSAVLDVFLDEKLHCDYFVGVSAGFAYGLSYLSGQKRRNLDILQRYGADRRYLSFWNLFNPRNKSVYGLQFAFYDVPLEHVALDFDALESSCARSFAAVTNVHSGKGQYLPAAGREALLDIVLATCAMPALFPIVEYQGAQYMDGGITNPIPFALALDAGYEKNIVILTRERTYEKHQERVLTLAAGLYRKYPAFVKALRCRSAVYNAQREQLFELERQGRVLVITPQDTSYFGRMERNPAKILELYKQGLRVTRERLPQIKEYLEI